MSLQGTVNKSFLMLTVLLVAALWPWTRFFEASGDPAAVSGLMLSGVVGGLIVGLIITFRQTTAPYLALPYAALQGLAIGGISAIFERRYPGIAIQAVALTFGVMAALLLAYTTKLIRVTEHFRAMVVAATGAIALLYLASFILGFFHIQVPFLNDASPLGIIVSLAIIVVAALNLVMDFDFIQTGVERGAPRYLEWYGAFALILTLVWLYLEILRLLGKTRQR
ncbi:MAG: Bax inhibitor-1/YccA family protein [Sinobacteraceae bacterium]|nr:Bax inhibitor-1/YccA family protein [Nevskiaceae bacterium]